VEQADSQMPRNATEIPLKAFIMGLSMRNGETGFAPGTTYIGERSKKITSNAQNPSAVPGKTQHSYRPRQIPVNDT
jgi:hypothetical protein